MGYVERANELYGAADLTDIDRLMLARDLVRQVRNAMPIDSKTQAKRGCIAATAGIEIAWKELEDATDPLP